MKVEFWDYFDDVGVIIGDEGLDREGEANRGAAVEVEE